LLTLPQLLQQLLLLGDIDPRPDESLESLIASQRNSYATYVTNLSIWSHNPIGEIECVMVDQHVLNASLHEVPVFRVHEVQVLLYGWRVAARIKAVNLEQFGRPIIESGIAECPATHMRESLTFAQVKLGSLQVLLGTFTIIDVS